MNPVFNIVIEKGKKGGEKGRGKEMKGQERATAMVTYNHVQAGGAACGCRILGCSSVILTFLASFTVFICFDFRTSDLCSSCCLRTSSLYDVFVLRSVDTLLRNVKCRSVFVVVLHLVFLSQQWKDNRLAWNVDEFEGLDMIWIPVKNMWTPDVMLYNK